MSNLPKILLFSGSTRNGSLNQMLVNSVAKFINGEGGTAAKITLADFAMPIYDGDFEIENGIPENVRKLHGLFKDHHGIFIACPEYNGGYTPLLKNAIDWVSRIRNEGQESVFRNRIFALGAAAPGKFGGLRGLLNIRPVLEVALGARVLPNQIVISNAKKVFDENGEIADVKESEFVKQVAALIVSESRRFVD